MQKSEETLTVAMNNLAGTYTYQQYRQLTDQLLAKNSTTGANQSAFYVDYTRQNVQRMNRAEELLTLPADVAQQITKPYDFLLISEPWCGDASYTVPVIAALAKALPAVHLNIVLRDEHLELMDKFLTNGGRSIAKLVIIDPMTHQVLGSWGPRPAAAQELALAIKAKPEYDLKDLTKQLFEWYEKDKGESTVEEILEILRKFE